MNANEFTKAGYDMLQNAKAMGHDIAIIAQGEKFKRVIGTYGGEPSIRGITPEMQIVPIETIEGL